MVNGRYHSLKIKQPFPRKIRRKNNGKTSVVLEIIYHLEIVFQYDKIKYNQI